MVFWIRHKFQTAKADGTNVTLVKPTNWNDDHSLHMEEGTIIGRPPGSGPGEGTEIPISAMYMPGMITLWGGITAPAGWFLCQGQSLLRADYPNLFAVIGGYYGAVDGTHFSLPDMRGRVAAGVDGTGRLTGNTINNSAVPGGAGGQETEQAYADITTSVVVSGRGWGATNSVLNVHVAGGTQWSGDGWGGSYNNGPLVGNHYHGVDFWNQTDTGASVYVDGTYYGSGSGGGYTRAVSNVQPTLMLNYIIKG
jgi:microcystin-dependent protein